MGISYFWAKFWDSRHAQLAIYTVFHEESESAVRIDQFLQPEEKIKNNQTTRVQISYRFCLLYVSTVLVPVLKPPLRPPKPPPGQLETRTARQAWTA